MHNAISIQNGPFEGTFFDQGETYLAETDDGSVRYGVHLSRLTQQFLTVFKPSEGWSVSIEGEIKPFDMVPLPNRDPAAVDPGQHVPTALFVASLRNSQGRVIATASTLWTLRGPTEWEKGETNARLRLYDAVGLQSKFHGIGQEQRSTYSGRSDVVQFPVADKKPIVVVPLDNETSKSNVRVAPATDQPASDLQQERDEAVVDDDAVSVSDATSETETAAKLTSEASPDAVESTNSQEPLDLGSTDPEQQPPAKALLQQIERLAKLLNIGEVPVLKTRAAATAFLVAMQGG